MRSITALPPTEAQARAMGAPPLGDLFLDLARTLVQQVTRPVVDPDEALVVPGRVPERAHVLRRAGVR